MVQLGSGDRNPIGVSTRARKILIHGPQYPDPWAPARFLFPSWNGLAAANSLTVHEQETGAQGSRKRGRGSADGRGGRAPPAAAGDRAGPPRPAGLPAHHRPVVRSRLHHRYPTQNTPPGARGCRQVNRAGRHLRLSDPPAAVGVPQGWRSRNGSRSGASRGTSSPTSPARSGSPRLRPPRPSTRGAAPRLCCRCSAPPSLTHGSAGTALSSAPPSSTSWYALYCSRGIVSSASSIPNVLRLKIGKKS